MRKEPVVKTSRILFTLGLITLLARVLGVPAVAGAASGPETLKKHVEWLGGEAAWQAVEGLRLEGTVKVSGLEGSLSVTLFRQGYQLNQYDLKVVQGREGVNPDDAWEINPSGQIETMGADKAAMQRRQIGQAFGLHLVGKDGSKRTFPGMEEKDGKNWEVVRFNYPGGDYLDLFLDPADGSCAWARQLEDTETSWVHFTDWRMVDGLRFPFSQESTFDIPMKNQTVTWNTITVLHDLDPGEFERPAPEASPVSILDPSGSTAWIPMDLYLDRYIYLRGTVNGTGTDIVLDSGAGMTVLDKATADNAGLVGEGALPAVGTGGAVEASMVNDITLEIGSLHLEGISAAVIDLSDINKRLGRGLSVILGKEVFHSVIVDIDYPNHRIAFHDPESWSYEGDGTEMTLLPAEDGHKRFTMQVENLPPAEFDLDTGNGSEMVLFGAYADANGILDGRARVSESQGGGVGGRRVSKITTLRSVTFAGHVLEDVPVTIAPAQEGAFNTTRNAGNVGASIFTRFHMVFDYPGDRMFVEPGADWDAPFRKNRTGIQADFVDGSLDVSYVAPESPAAAAGIKTGDRILAMNGKEPGDDFWKTDYKVFFGEEGSKLKLDLADGRSVELELATYY